MDNLIHKGINPATCRIFFFFFKKKERKKKRKKKCCTFTSIFVMFGINLLLICMCKTKPGRVGSGQFYIHIQSKLL